MRRSAEFLYRRTKGEKVKKLSTHTGINYDANEKAWKDLFKDAYTGKDYRWGFGETNPAKVTWTDMTLVKDPRKSKKLIYGTEIGSIRFTVDG